MKNVLINRRQFVNAALIAPSVASCVMKGGVNGAGARALAEHPRVALSARICDVADGKEIANECRTFVPEMEAGGLNLFSYGANQSRAECGIVVTGGLSLEDIVKGQFSEIVKESDDTSDLIYRIRLGVSWESGKEAVRIEFGEFQLAQKNPLVSFSNSWCALSQAGETIQELFNGKQKMIETNWDFVPFDPQRDIYGAATGALLSNLMTGESFVVTYECLLE